MRCSFLQKLLAGSGVTVPIRTNKLMSTDTLPITHKRLMDWAGFQVVRDAKVLVQQGLVLTADYAPPYIKGSLLHNNREFHTRMRILRDGNYGSAKNAHAGRDKFSRYWL